MASKLKDIFNRYIVGITALAFGLNNMTLLFQTRCPQCHGYFNVSEAQVNQADAKGRCGRCKNVFLINDYLDNSELDSAELESDSHHDNKTSQESIADTPVQDSDTNNIIPFAPILPTAKHKYKDNPTHFKKMIFKNNKDSSGTVDNATTDDNTLEFDKIDNPNDSNDLGENDGEKDHNKMTTDVVVEEDLEYNSIDKMEVWLSQLKQETPEESLEHKLSEDSAHNVDSLAPRLNIEEKRKLPSKTNAFTDNNDSISTINTDQVERDNKISIKKQSGSLNIDDSEFSSEDNLSELLSKINQSSEKTNIADNDRDNNAQLRQELKQKRLESSIATGLWLAGCLVLTLLLGAQYVIFNLDNLVKNPAHAARLQSFCSALACSLPSADISTLKVNNISYVASKVNTLPGFSDIRANLSNQNPQAQLLPNLKVSVYGSNALIGEFIATPDKYVLSTEYQINAEQAKPVMFTVKVPVNQIRNIKVEPIY